MQNTLSITVIRAENECEKPTYIANTNEDDYRNTADTYELILRSGKTEQGIHDENESKLKSP